MAPRHILFGLAALACNAQAQQPNYTAEAYEKLKTGTIWIHPKVDPAVVDVATVQKAVAESRLQVRILVVPELGSKWWNGKGERRGAFAKWLQNEQLRLKDTCTVVATKHGVTTYSDRIPENRLVEINDLAAKKGSPSNLTPVIVSEIEAVSTETQGKVRAETQTPTTAPSTAPAPSLGAFWLCPLVLVAFGGGAWILKRQGTKRRALAKAEGYKDRAVNGISFLDSYMDLLPTETDKKALGEARERAAAELEAGMKLLALAQTPNEADGASLQFEKAHAAAETGKEVISRATGGTSVAYAEAPADLAGLDDPRIYQPVKNVCYFCSKPGDGDLTPVTLNVQGERKTVLVCPKDLATIHSGQQPQIMGQNTGGRFVPWYNVSSYDPTVNYGAGNWFWQWMALDAVSDVFRHRGNTYVTNNYDQSESTSASAFTSGTGGGDFGGSWDSGGGSFDSGGGSFDSGGGGFDSGSGGGDF
ncbi:MAG: hypothetical protein JSS66_02680 [Armatimonadetes bacterium]|nr:hypothetical protein [Armatimonadota bacterium]